MIKEYNKTPSQVEEILKKDFIFLSYEESLSYPKLALVQHWIKDKIEHIPSNNEFVIAGGAPGQIACLGSISITSDIDIFPLKPWNLCDPELKDKYASPSMKEKADELLKQLENANSSLSPCNEVLRLKTKPVETENSFNFLISTDPDIDGRHSREISFIKPSVLMKKYNMDNGSHSFEGTAGELLLSFDIVNAMIAVDKYQNILCHKYILSDKANELRISDYFTSIHDRVNHSEEFEMTNKSSPYRTQIKTTSYIIPIFSRVHKYLMKNFTVPHSTAMELLFASENKPTEILDALYLQSHPTWNEEEVSLFWSIFYHKFGNIKQDAIWWRVLNNNKVINK